MGDLVEKVYGEILQLLHRSYGRGHKLPSERRLADMYAVSQTVVHEAVKRLRKDGIIATVARRGNFVAHGSLKGHRRQYGIYIQGNVVDWVGQSGFEVDVLIGIRKQLRNAGCSLLALGRERVASGKTPDAFESFPEEIPWNRIDGLFVLGFDDEKTLRSKYLRGGPVMALDQDTTALGLDCVTFDDDMAGELAARHLYELSHRRFALVEEFSRAEFPYDPAWLRRKTAFERGVLARRCSLLPEWRIPWSRFARSPGGGEFWQSRLRALVAQRPSQRPTAIFCPDAYIMAQMAEFLQTLNQPVPRSFSMIAVGGAQNLAAQSSPVQPTLLTVNGQELGERAVEAMQEALRLGPPGPKRAARAWYVPPHFVEGRSTAMCQR